MAWIEQRYDKHRVYWTNPAGSARRRDSEQFDTRAHAEMFLELIAAKGGDPLAARAHIHPQSVSASVTPAGEPELTLGRLAKIFLAGKTGVYRETRAAFARGVRGPRRA